MQAAPGARRTIDRLRADDASLAAASHTALLDLYSLDTQLASAQSRLGALERQAGELRSRRASIGRQLRLARLDARISQNRLAQRVRFIYDHGNTSTLELLLGARSLDEALTQLDGVNRVASANQDVLAQVTSAQHQLVRLSHSLALDAVRLTAATHELAGTVESLAQTRAERAKYLDGLRERRAFDAAEIARLGAQARAAAARSEQLQAAAATPPPSAARAASAPSPVTAAVPAAAPGQGRTLTVVTVAYSLPGHTASGLPVGPGIVAVDPSVIPLGTHMSVPGYGPAIAADTGTAIRVRCSTSGSRRSPRLRPGAAAR